MTEPFVNLKSEYVGIIKDLCRFSSAWKRPKDCKNFRNLLKICITPDAVAFEATDGYRLGYLLLNGAAVNEPEEPTFYAVDAAELYKALVKNTSYMMFGKDGILVARRGSSPSKMVPYVVDIPKMHTFYFGKLASKLTEPHERPMRYNLELAYQGWAWLTKVRETWEPLPAVENFKVAYINPLEPKSGAVMWLIGATGDGNAMVQAAYLLQPLASDIAWKSDVYAAKGGLDNLYLVL